MSRIWLHSMALSLVLTSLARAQPPEFPIWPGPSAPGSEQWTQKELKFRHPRMSVVIVRNVVVPTLTVYAPERARANGAAVIIAPGGGLRVLAWENEGTAMAEWLAARGITAFILKYRLLETPADPHEFDRAMEVYTEKMLKVVEAGAREQDRQHVFGEAEQRTAEEVLELAIADGRQAVKYVRAHATDWGLRVDRIGMMGFSAGASVTMGVLLAPQPDSRPDFVALIYGGALKDRTTPANRPPLFLLVAQDDRLVYDHVQQIYREWSAAGAPVEMHAFMQGGHGFGMLNRKGALEQWPELYLGWLTALGLR